jgi:16S rRNA (guanine1207-N2)-methyltransferase
VSADPALETLLLPISERRLRWPTEGGALFLRARDGWPLHRQPLPGLRCEQPFKPEVDALLRSGIEVAASVEADARFPLILLLPPRQRDEARALYAQALARLSPGGVLLACQSNDEGARSSEADLTRLAGPLMVLCKHKCRVFWTRPGSPADVDLLEQWRTLDAPRPIMDGRFVSRPGVFAWDRADAASNLLAEHLPTDLCGRAADLGAGYGYLSSELLRRCPGVTSLDAFEADARALALAERNLAGFASHATLGFHWHDVTCGLAQRYHVIVSNPPFHAQQGEARPDIGRRFISAAADALLPGGRLFLVANRHLPYEAVLDSGFAEARALTQQHGFKVIEAIKSAAAPKPAAPARR